jgi:hypothetical protein
MKGDFITCKNIGSYSEALSKGKKYEIIEEEKEKVRIMGDNGRTRWYSKYCFDLEGNTVPVLIQWKFDDFVEENDIGEDFNWIEISFKLSDGTERWSILYTPERLLTSFKRPNLDPPGLHISHLIIVRSYRKDDVDRILKYLDDNDELISASLPLNRDFE